MNVFAYELPTTGTFSFSDCFSDLSHQYSTSLAEATQARANLRALLKESKRIDGDKDYLRIVKTIEDYLPYLYGVLACVRSGELTEKQRPIFSWRTTLSANLFNSSPRLALPGLHAELVFALLTYAFARSNLARLNTAALGAYERARGLSEEERKERDTKLGFAVSHFCSAAGVFAHVADVVLVEAEKDPRWLHGVDKVPCELTKEVASALSKLSLVSAQALAIRKQLSKASADAVLSPGPPLPRSHPSTALLAKLHLEAASLCASANALLRIPGASRARIKSPLSPFSRKDKDREKEGDGAVAGVSSDLIRFSTEMGALHTALAHKWLGVDAGEGDQSRAGYAVGFLTWAKTELEAARDASGSAGKDESKDDRRDRRERLQREIESATAFLRHYKKLNDTLAFKQIPVQSELQSSVPAGSQAVSVRVYTPATPSFGPGSELAQRLADPPGEGVGVDVGAAQPADSSGSSYLGAGAYF